MSIHEECGVFGVSLPEPSDVSALCYYGLFALQHRGQESCGIVVNDDGVFFSHKDAGLLERSSPRRRLAVCQGGTWPWAMSATAPPAAAAAGTASQ